MNLNSKQTAAVLVGLRLVQLQLDDPEGMDSWILENLTDFGRLPMPSIKEIDELCEDLVGDVELAANVCNRGTNPVPDGARVVFWAGNPDTGAPIACETVLPRLLVPGDCTEVACTWTVPAGTTTADVTVVVDPDGEVFECRNGNNRGVIPSVYCGLI